MKIRKRTNKDVILEDYIQRIRRIMEFVATLPGIHQGIRDNVNEELTHYINEYLDELDLEK